jgi:hypothetical protein
MNAVAQPAGVATPAIRPFRVNVLQAELDDLRRRVDETPRLHELCGAGRRLGAFVVELGTRPETLAALEDSPVGLATFMIDHDARSLELIESRRIRSCSATASTTRAGTLPRGSSRSRSRWICAPASSRCATSPACGGSHRGAPSIVIRRRDGLRELIVHRDAETELRGLGANRIGWAI